MVLPIRVWTNVIRVWPCLLTHTIYGSTWKKGKERTLCPYAYEPCHTRMDLQPYSYHTRMRPSWMCAILLTHIKFGPGTRPCTYGLGSYVYGGPICIKPKTLSIQHGSTFFQGLDNFRR